MSSRFVQELEKRILILDGAMGTSIHKIDLDLDKDYLGKENCTEVLVLTRPDVIQGIHESFLEVGADAVETDTFGANKLVLAEFDLTDQTREINKVAAQIARRACEKYATPDKPRFVIGSVGPGTKLVTLGNTDWDTMLESYTEQFRGLIDGGVDVFLIETAQDILQVKCAINAAIDALKEAGKTTDDIPIMVQVTIETTGTMLLGTEIAAAANALAPFPILSLGMNCATGPTEMAEHVQWLGQYWDRHISVLPNAGLPTLVDGHAEFPLKPEPFAQAMLKFVQEHGVTLVGGCCGTTPQHIGRLAELVASAQPIKPQRQTWPPACSSLYSVTDYRQDASLLNVGERTNASGSRAFKRMLEAETWDDMVSLAREQIREGSHVIDINVDYAGRDNAADMAKLTSLFVTQINVPLMLDSTQVATIEAGLKRAGGKCIINSANLEDGEEKFATMLHMAKRYGSAIVLGTIDEDPEEAMARTADRKLSIATRMYELATKKYGIDPHDIFFDPLVLPISTGMDKDRRSALETIEGVRRIAAAMPECQITCGLSNVSFGLKPVARVVLNSVFLYELSQAGLTSAIVHVSKILPKSRIPDEQWDAALDLIYDRRNPGDPLQKFIDLFPDDAQASHATAQVEENLTIEEKLQRHIIDGEKRNLVEDLEEARKQYDPLAIINDHLLGGMKVVGELFGSGQMQLPFVLQSAEVMKMAVAHLEQYMEKIEGQSKGKIVLATVKGDVHDIGKNLVDIILSNNGYTVYNLGIKQHLDPIIEAFNQHDADAIGLSGLLVKSVTVMKENIDELNRRGLKMPLMLGGAALSRPYCESELRSAYQGRVYYGKDAFEGLRLMDALVNGRAEELEQEIETRLAKRADAEAKIAASQATRDDQGESAITANFQPAQIDRSVAIPEAPFFGSRVVEDIPLDSVYPFINRVALYRGQWQYKKGRMDDQAFAEQVDGEVKELFDRLAKQCRDEKILAPKVVYGYYPCNGDGNDLVVYDAVDHDKEIQRFTFPRQQGRQHLCISDFFLPVDSGRKDVLGLSCVTVGPEASVRTKALFQNNEYTEYLYLHGFSVETAEALAEMWHKRMRQELGIGVDDSAKIRELFTQHYRGSRYSFGYPACPEMSDQDKLFALIDPARIGCHLTENWQIDPEQSTSALIVHHPQAKYFSI